MNYSDSLILQQLKNNPLYLKCDGGGKMICSTQSDCYCHFFIKLYKLFPKGWIDYSIMLDELTVVNGILKKNVLKRLHDAGIKSEWVLVSNMGGVVLREAIKPFISNLVEILGGDFDIVNYESGFQMYLDLFNHYKKN